MSVSTFVQTGAVTRQVNIYHGYIDADFSVVKRSGAAFAPHEQPVPDMTVALDSGHVFSGTTLTEVGVQSTGVIVAPVTDPREIVFNEKLISCEAPRHSPAHPFGTIFDGLVSDRFLRLACPRPPFQSNTPMQQGHP